MPRLAQQTIDRKQIITEGVDMMTSISEADLLSSLSLFNMWIEVPTLIFFSVLMVEAINLDCTHC